jgi:hypothetical protein
MASRFKTQNTSVEDVIRNLTSLAKKMRVIYEVVGEEGIEQVYDDLKDMIDYLITVNRDLERCRRKHIDVDRDEMATKAALAKQLALALQEVRHNCPDCRGDCTHWEPEGALIRQVDLMLGEAKRAKLLPMD